MTIKDLPDIEFSRCIAKIYVRSLSKLSRYMDAGFPIIYINTFEEEKTDDIIKTLSGGREIYEWNGTQGWVDMMKGIPVAEDGSLEEMLDRLKEPKLLERKIIVLKE